MNLKNLLLSLLLVTIGAGQALAAESTGTATNANFTASTAEFANPGRGLVVNGGDLATVTANNITTWRTAGYRLVGHKASLAAYVTTATLPAPFLQTLTDAAALHRAGGTKMVLRFIYSAAQGQAEPTLTIALGHVDQMRPFLRANADVIAFLQAGFLGINGQWGVTASTTIGNGSTQVSNAAQDALRTALFASTDKRTPIEFPLPLAVRRWFPTPLGASQKFSGSDQSRAGFHNDGFLSSPNDGTVYLDPATNLLDATLSNPLRAYADSSIQSGVAMGVEAFGNGRTTCAAMLSEGQTYQVSHLQGDASNVYINSWTTNNCIDEIKRSLGYRFQLKRVSHQSTVNPGDSITINVELQNLGWAAPFTQRRVRAQLINGSTTITCTSAVDLRSLPPSGTTNYVVPVRCSIPFDTPTASYTMYLSAPDAWPGTSSNALFSIQWANANATGQTWDATNGRISTNTTVAVGTTTNVGGQAPEPGSLTGLTSQTSTITATSGMVISGKSFNVPNGPCIYIPAGVQNVLITGNRAVGCGTSQVTTLNREFVYIGSGAGGGAGITIQRNEIADFSAGVFAAGALHPIVIDRNQVWNIRGPRWQGQFVQFNNVRGGQGSSKITCNVIDGDYKPGFVGGANQHIEDHISLYNVLGNGAANPVEIAYNRIIGSDTPSDVSKSGSGMQLGDGANGQNTIESGWYYAHHNTVVGVGGIGISAAGGHDIRFEYNTVDQRRPTVYNQTGRAYGYANHSANLACYNVSYVGNRGTYSRVWAYDNGWRCPNAAGQFVLPGNADGTPNTTFGACQEVWNPTDTVYGTGCTNVTFGAGNSWNDSGLMAKTRRQIFEEKYTQCNSTGGTGTGGGTTYSKTRMFPLGATPTSLYQPAVAGEVRAGQDISLKIRVYGVPLPTSTKLSMWLVNSNNTYNGDATNGGVNHFDLFPSATWNGFTGTEYTYNLYIPSGATPDTTYKILANFYSSVPPSYPNYFDNVDCDATAPYINVNGSVRGCHIGNLTVRPAGGVPASTTYNTLSGSSVLMTGSNWAP